MTVGEYQDAVDAYNAAHDDEAGPVLTEVEEDTLVRIMGL